MNMKTLAMPVSTISPEQVVSHLTLRSYSYQRDLHGMSAEAAARIFKNAEALEAAYQAGKQGDGAA